MFNYFYENFVQILSQLLLNFIYIIYYPFYIKYKLINKYDILLYPI